MLASRPSAEIVEKRPASRWLRAWPWAAAAVALLAALRIYGIRVLRLWDAILDDAYISMRYARHFAQGDGLVYNLGERVEGYTNFLWTCLLAVPHALGVDAFDFTKAASAVCGVAAAAGTFQLARTVLAASRPGEPREPLDDALAVLPAALLLATPSFAISTGEGLETTLFTALLVLAVERVFAERRPEAFPVSALLAAALVMTRPDGLLFVPWLALVAWRLGRSRQYLLRFAAVFLLVVGAYGAWRFLYYGHPLPNTFYAKTRTAGDDYLWARGSRQLRQFVALSGGWILLATLAAFVRRRTRWVAAALAGVVLLRVAFHFWSGGPYMGQFRFLVPVLPFVWVLVALAADATVGWRLPRVAVAALLGVAMLAPGWHEYRQSETRLRFYGKSLNRGHVRLGKAIAAHSTPAAVIAMVDAGATPYFSERETIDLLGLNDEHIARVPGPFGLKVDIPYVLGRRPDLVILVSRRRVVTESRQLSLPISQQLFDDARFRESYAYVRPWQFHTGYWLHVFRRVDSTALDPTFWAPAAGT